MEQQLVNLIKSGQKDRALHLMAKTWGTQIGRFCAVQTGSASDGEDLLQETFIEAWGSLDSWRGEASLKSWLYGIARNLCASHLRKKDRRRGLFQWFFGWGEEDNAHMRASDDLLETTESQRMLSEAVGRLKTAQREAVLLFYMSGLSMLEISEVLDISPANARKRVSLGVAALREDLRGELMKPAGNELNGESDHDTEDNMSEYKRPRLIKS